MWVSSLRVQNFRSFVDSGVLDLGPINVMIGPNNAGKSSLLRAIYALQQGVGDLSPDSRSGAESPRIDMSLRELHTAQAWGMPGNSPNEGTLALLQRDLGRVELTPRGEATRGVEKLPDREPLHAIVPILARRKTVSYNEDVGEQQALLVSSNLRTLAAKLSRLGNYAFPVGQQYRDTCERILGFVVTAVPSPNGQRPGVYLPDRSTLPLDQLGEGVPNLVGILADLALSEDKIVLIEEPETDLHPQALKALLDLIEVSATVNRNQFMISTHSNIVLRQLGAADDARVFYVDAERGPLPITAQVEEIARTPGARLRVLRDLGYSFSDFDLWDGWLILEESSAERIIRDYLVPWFAPRLARVRTLSTKGNSAVEPTFEDFHRLVRFTHLEEAYRNAAWVRVDGDEEGLRIVDRLRERYDTWEPDRFGTFPARRFEDFYPEAFRERVAALEGLGRQELREAKRELLDDVRAWLDEDEERGKTALAASASAVIADLETISQQLAASETPAGEG